MTHYFYKESRTDNVASVQFLSERRFVTKLTGSQASRFVAESLRWERAQQIPDYDFEAMAELHAARKGRRRKKDPIARFLTLVFTTGNYTAPGIDWGKVYDYSFFGPPGWIAGEGQPDRIDPAQLKAPLLRDGKLNWNGCGTDWRIVREWADEVEIASTGLLTVEDHHRADAASLIDLEQLFYFEDPFSREVIAVKWDASNARLSLPELRTLVVRTAKWNAAKPISKQGFLNKFRANCFVGEFRNFPVMVVQPRADPDFEITTREVADDEILSS